ncbi:NADPH-dependent FMN reductase [Paenactinomyces guangxiensis]|uniref:NAD(P)H-dependent oxidoreductase n=1 Tax=Paenactinomyces guangxiensis TaxID=1490290 RepID=A0A7W1WS44_9BACL|nr:NADPH-dependent FMN reductase [Paenactinomyces guangxiensis]MBA4494954.1 NAD(P)H-dependent oxidoreductase [Paenactinomyces guangxiensis]MBH8592037.1 NAD(P)H-dependent oxidoreductase [Paenactinomyces guangxiensis]
MKIVAIAGSLSQESTTHKTVAIIARAANEAGAEVEVFDLRKYPLPIYDGRADESTYPETVRLFKEKMMEADGFIFASPEYHGSISGVLKNALDFIGARELEGKVVALAGTAGGALGATNTLNTMNIICRTLHAWPLPSMPSVPQSYMAFKPDGTLKDEKIQKRLEDLGKNLVNTIRLFHSQVSYK